MIESIKFHSMSTSLGIRGNARCQIPAFYHRLNRSYTDDHGPNAAGKSRQGAPVRKRHKMPSTIILLSLAGRLFLPVSGGSHGDIFRHIVSVKISRSIPNHWSGATFVAMALTRASGYRIQDNQIAPFGMNGNNKSVRWIHSLIAPLR